MKIGPGLRTSVDETPTGQAPEATPTDARAVTDAYAVRIDAASAAELAPLKRDLRYASALDLRLRVQESASSKTDEILRAHLSPHVASLDVFGIAAWRVPEVVLQPLAASRWAALAGERLKGTPLAQALHSAVRDLANVASIDRALAEQLGAIAAGVRDATEGHPDETHPMRRKAAFLLERLQASGHEPSVTTRGALVDLARALLEVRASPRLRELEIGPGLARAIVSAIVTHGDEPTRDALVRSAGHGFPQGIAGTLMHLADTHPARIRVEIALAAGIPPAELDLLAVADASTGPTVNAQQHRTLLEAIAAKEFEPNVAASLLREFPVSEAQQPRRASDPQALKRLMALADNAARLEERELRKELKHIIDDATLALSRPASSAHALVAWDQLLRRDPSLASSLRACLTRLHEDGAAGRFTVVAKAIAGLLEALLRDGIPLDLGLEYAPFLSDEQRRRLALAALEGGTQEEARMCAVVCMTGKTDWIDALDEHEATALLDWLDRFARRALVENPALAHEWATRAPPALLRSIVAGAPTHRQG
ncbi:MAG: hypothetical protein IT381_21675 [Deltaproteobacteria bacterium]|nr:hypothetical protein [Deltaproteobacteria bacterium]